MLRKSMGITFDMIGYITVENTNSSFAVPEEIVPLLLETF